VDAFLLLLACSVVSARSCLPLSACHRGCRTRGPSREEDERGLRRLQLSRPYICDPTGEGGPGVDGISFTVHPGRQMKYRPAQVQAGARHRRQPRRPDLHRQLSLAGGGARRVPERQQGEGGAIVLLRRGQEDAVAAPRFGAPGRRRHGHRPRAALACARWWRCSLEWMRSTPGWRFGVC